MPDQQKPKTPFEDFLLAEYANLAQAFFSAATGITQFFQYYLLALGVPLTAVGVILKVSPANTDLTTLARSTLGRPLGWLFVIVGLVGVCMAMYIANLRLDAILYARSVNGIRRYFYARATDVREFRVLPDDIRLPKYFEPTFFLFVILAFAFMNSAYFCLGRIILAPASPNLTWTFLGSTALHVAAYWGLAKRRDYLFEAYQRDTGQSKSGPPTEP